jgi:hypothetical protein
MKGRASKRASKIPISTHGFCHGERRAVLTGFTRSLRSASGTCGTCRPYLPSRSKIAWRGGVHCEIVKPAQVAVGGKGSPPPARAENARPGFPATAVGGSNRSPVGHRALRASPLAAELGLHKFGHHFVPIAADMIRVGGSQGGFGDLQIQRGLPDCLVLRAHDLAGLVLVVGAEAGALAGGRIHAIISATAQAAAHQSVSCFHLSSGDRKDK